MHEADGEHAPSRRVAFNDAFHPVLVVCSLVEHHQNFALLELQLIVIVGIAVVKSSATF